MLQSCPIVLMLPLMIFSAAMLIVMWPGVLLVYRGEENLEFRREKVERYLSAGLILLGFIWLQLFLSAWAFYVATHPCPDMDTEGGPGVFCFTVRLVYSLAPITVLYAVTDFRAVLIFSHIIMTTLVYIASFILVGVGGRVSAWGL